MKISRTVPPTAYQLQSFLAHKKITTATSSPTIKTSSSITLAQQRMHLGYNRHGSEIAVNTATNQTTILGAAVRTKTTPSTFNEDTVEGRAAQYTGSQTATEIAEKFSKGDTVSDSEYYFMIKGIGIGDNYDAARISRSKSLEEKKLAHLLTSSGIQLTPDQELNISVDTQNQVTLSGTADSKKLQNVQDALNSQYNLLADLYQVSSNTYKNVSKLYYSAAAALAPAEQYLQQHTDGKTSLTDLSVQDGKIIGLPPALENLLNKADASYNLNNPTDKAAKEAKSEIVNLLAHIKVYGANDLPHIGYTLRYKNSKLSIIEQPDLIAKHPETLTSAEYNDKANLLQNNPMAYYQWFTQSAKEK